MMKTLIDIKKTSRIIKSGGNTIKLLDNIDLQVESMMELKLDVKDSLHDIETWGWHIGGMDCGKLSSNKCFVKKVGVWPSDCLFLYLH